ncbi:MAG TPA: DUF5995 family protein, partial [Candidatus Hydrogenedentes bacterium]|nr:DUF5995 family protein [Candidatus Hydrogenedentota bacterium]
NATILIDAGHFDDGQWVAAFMVAFGNLYRQAFLDYESGNLDKVPATWRVTFDAAIENNSSVFQHALMGIHSHINRDMAYALAAVTPVNERAGRFADFVRTNDFIVASIDPVENAVAQFDSALGMLDAQLGGIDERLLEKTLTQWRFRAWRLAATIDLTGNTQSGQFFSAYLDHIAEKRAVRIRDARPLYELGNNSPKASLAVVRRWCW